MLYSDHRKNERAAAIQSVGMLLERRKQHQHKHEHRHWVDDKNWMGFDENVAAAGGPRSILKGNGPVENGKEHHDLNNNLLVLPTESKEEPMKYATAANGVSKSVKKGLRWKCPAEDDFAKEEQPAAAGEEEAFRCCSVCGGRIWDGDCKSAIFGQCEELLVHWACFRCATCGLDLGDEQQKKVFKREGRFYCEVHGHTASLLAAGERNRAKVGAKPKETVTSAKDLPPPMTAKMPAEGQKKWWERNTDEFNGNKRSSTTIRFYGDGNQQMLSDLYSDNTFKEEKKRILSNFADKLAPNKKSTTFADFKQNKAAKVWDNKLETEEEDHCQHCGIELSGPFVLAKGRAWCPEHFCCANSACAKGLLESGFVEDPSSKRNYCPKCYEVLIAPVCHKCSLPLTESCLNALGQKWHPDCFNCAHCRKPFGTQSFFLENGKPYCENDWNQLFTTKCVECHEPIKVGQKWLEALGGRSFHSECFRCNTCNVVLEGQTFFERGQRPYCRAHATQQKMAGRR